MYVSALLGIHNEEEPVPVLKELWSGKKTDTKWRRVPQ